jgi:hypothetical protein
MAGEEHDERVGICREIGSGRYDTNAPPMPVGLDHFYVSVWWLLGRAIAKLCR